MTDNVDCGSANWTGRDGVSVAVSTERTVPAAGSATRAKFASCVTSSAAIPADATPTLLTTAFDGPSISVRNP